MEWADLCCLILGIDLWSWCARFKSSCAKIFLRAIKLIKNVIYIYIFQVRGFIPWITSAAAPAKQPMNLCQSTRQPNHGLNMFIPNLVPCGLSLQLIATKLTLMEPLLKMKIELGLGLSLEMTKIWWLLLYMSQNISSSFYSGARSPCLVSWSMLFDFGHWFVIMVSKI